MAALDQGGKAMTVRELGVAGDGASLARLSLAAVEFCREAPRYRGHANASWKLIPSVFRDGDEEWERSLANDFVRLAPARFTNCPLRGMWADWLCLMRHHSLPTRLLDWTHSILVAAYFACESRDKVDGEIWVIASARMNSAMAGHGYRVSMLGEMAWPYVIEPFQSASSNLIGALLVEPPHVDPRMTAQHSSFTIHADGVALETHKQAPEFLARIRVPQERKEQILSQLDALGFSRLTLFPDLDNLSAALAARRYGSSA